MMKVQVWEVDRLIGSIELFDGALKAEGDSDILQDIIAEPIHIPQEILPSEGESFLRNLHLQYKSAYLRVGKVEGEIEEAWSDEAREKSLETRRARATLANPESKLPDIHGHAVTAVIRRLTKEGFTKEHITKVLSHFGIEINPGTLNTQMGHGKKGTGGEHAPLTDEQLEHMRVIVEGRRDIDEPKPKPELPEKREKPELPGEHVDTSKMTAEQLCDHVTKLYEKADEAIWLNKAQPLLEAYGALRQEKYELLRSNLMAEHGLTEKIKELDARERVVDRKWEVLREGQNQANRELTRAVVLPIDRQANITLRLDPKLTPTSLAGIKNGIRLFNHHVDKSVIVGDVSVRPTPRGERSSYSNQAKALQISPDYSSARVIVHELGHWLESTHPDWQNQLLAYRAKVTNGAPLKQLPISEGFDESEKYRERTDGKQWIDKYMGKHYQGQNDTELLSMGLEKYVEQPGRLATQDPELFKLVAKMVRGK